MECTQRNLRDSGFLRTYTIIHAYFALVQGSSYLVSSPSFLYPSWVFVNFTFYVQNCAQGPWIEHLTHSTI